MTEVLPEFRPPWAITLWVSDRHIFAEVPVKAGGPPYIAKYPLTTIGLSTALNVLKFVHDQYGHMLYEPPAFKVARKTKLTAKPKVQLTAEQSERIANILKKKGLINE